MNSHCSICDVEAKCAYQYKPCDCCNYRKFVAKTEPKQEAQIIPLYKAQIIPLYKARKQP